MDGDGENEGEEGRKEKREEGGGGKKGRRREGEKTVEGFHVGGFSADRPG